MVAGVHVRNRGVDCGLAGVHRDALSLCKYCGVCGYYSISTVVCVYYSISTVVRVSTIV